MAIDTSVLNIDFEVLSGSTNCKVLKVIDLSNWASTINDPAYIHITTPGNTEAVTNFFDKKKVNTFNSNNLELSDVDDYSYLAPLPDGIYKICVSQCLGETPGQGIYTAITEDVCKYHFQDCQIRCEIAKKILSIDLTCSPCRKELLSKILDIQLFLDAAKAQADKCNPKKAMEYYNRASLLLSRISDPGQSGAGCKNC